MTELSDMISRNDRLDNVLDRKDGLNNNILIMKIIRAFLVISVMSLAAGAQAGNDDFRWKRDRMDGSRCGCVVPKADNVTEALGYVKGCRYYAPGGKVYRGGSVTKVAGLVIGAQPIMASVKETIAYSPEEMVKAYPESALSNFFIDTIMKSVEEASGKKVDVGIGNFGGIRVDMPKGDIIVDDIRSMFPFRNNIVYVALKGREIRAILDQMAAGTFQVLGGVRVVAKDGKIVSAEIGGEPLDDGKVYGVATISFLLNGGDRLFVARNAVEVIEYPIDIYDAMVKFIKAETTAGRPVTGKTDGRVVILAE